MEVPRYNSSNEITGYRKGKIIERTEGEGAAIGISREDLKKSQHRPITLTIDVGDGEKVITSFPASRVPAELKIITPAAEPTTANPALTSAADRSAGQQEAAGRMRRR